MTSKPVHTPFSQRAGLSPIPPQLQLGEVSAELRRLFDYYISLDAERDTVSGYDYAVFGARWKRIAMDVHVLLYGQDHNSFQNRANMFLSGVRRMLKSETIGPIFDLIEFIIQHQNCSPDLKRNLSGALVKARAAYRVIGDQIVAIGGAEQGAAFEAALAGAEAAGAIASQTHLIAAGSALRNSDWAGCVRESIHAVEAMALRLAPEATTLGPALAAIERRGHLHGSLKAAFGALYGYSSDEKGVRHALVFQKEAQVDEADALFMLGACASFVSYLASRSA